MATDVVTLVSEAVDPSPISRSPMSQTPRGMTVKMPLKILDPGRSKLSTVETKRIISVLDDTIVKVELVCMFPHIIENLEYLSIPLGAELTGALKEHLRLSNNMEATLTHLEEEGFLYKGAVKGYLFGTEDSEGILQLHKQGLSSSVRNIVRLFYANPIGYQVVRDADYARNFSADLFLKRLSEFRGFLFEKLLATPLEEREKIKFMQEIFLRDKKNTETVAALEDELTTVIQNRNDEISRKNSAIKDLKTHLHNLAKYSESQIIRTRQEAEKQQKGELRGSQAKCAKIQQDLNLLRIQLSALVAENRESELTLRKKKYKVEMEIENWVQKYDVEMIEKQEEYEEVDAVYVIEKAHLAELREKFTVLDQEFSQIQEERKVKQAQKEKAEKELAILVRAATLIQALWKGFLVRSLLRTRKKKKGKGKKAKK